MVPEGAWPQTLGGGAAALGAAPGQTSGSLLRCAAESNASAKRAASCESLPCAPNARGGAA
eukprot:11180427-Lingulodinium_polyedra.AAC.1